MRGLDHQQSAMFSYLSPEQRVPSDHPLRAVRQMADTILAQLSQVFSKMYSDIGRRSISPEKLLRALLLEVLYTVRSERMLMEQLEYNLLFRWFVGLNMDDPVWDPHGIQQESGPAAGGGRGGAVLPTGAGRGQGAGLGLGRTLHRRWNVTGGLGESEEFQGGGRRGSPAVGRSRQSDGEF